MPASQWVVLPSTGAIERQLLDFLQPERFFARIFELPGRAPLVAQPYHALVPESTAAREGNLQEIRCAVRARKCVYTCEENCRHHGRNE